MTHSRPAIRNLLDSHGLSPRRELGQNFMVDPNTVRKIAELSGVSTGDRVVEIGAGLGSLTLALVERGAHVTAIEYDTGLASALRAITAASPEVDVVEADAMQVDWSSLLNNTPHTLVANLPYNIATPLVCDILEEVPLITRLVVLVQEEAADRFVARPGSKQYGAVTLKVAHFASARKVAHVPPTVFMPRPNVESAVVDITRHVSTYSIDTEALFAIMKTAFGQRRKMLRRSLDGHVSDEAFAAAGISPEDRPERIDLQRWYRLVEAMQS